MSVIAVDTETDGLHPDDGARVKLISAAWDRCPEGRVWPVWKWPDERVRRLLLTLGRHELIFHNAKFDLMMIGATFGVDLYDAFSWDTMLAARVLQGPLGTVALKEIAARVWGTDVTAPERRLKEWLNANKLKKSDLIRAPRDVLWPYASMDAELTLRLYKLQTRLLEELGDPAGDSALIAREFEIMGVLYRMEKRGIGWDVLRARRAARKVRAEVERLRDVIPFKPTPRAAADYFFGKRGYIPTALSPKTHQPSMDANARAELIAQDAPWAREYDRYERLKRNAGMWFDGWTSRVGRDGRLRASYKQTGTVSMRFSSERVNLMAIPHDERLDLPKGVPSPRALFVAKPGHELWELDVSQAEVRVAASVTHCKPMMEILATGEDIHDETTIRLFNVTKGGDGWKTWRALGKRLNLAVQYGVGSREFSRQVKIHSGVTISPREAKSYIRTYFRTFPEIAKAMRIAEGRARRRGWVRLCSGMRRHFRPYEHDNLYKALNQVIQGGVAEAMKDAMIEIDKRWPGCLLLQIHDSVVVEIPAEHAKEVVEEMRAVMVRWFEHHFKLPFVVDAKKWGEAA